MAPCGFLSWSPAPSLPHLNLVQMHLPAWPSPCASVCPHAPHSCHSLNSQRRSGCLKVGRTLIATGMTGRWQASRVAVFYFAVPGHGNSLGGHNRQSGLHADVQMVARSREGPAIRKPNPALLYGRLSLCCLQTTCSHLRTVFWKQRCLKTLTARLLLIFKMYVMTR